MIALNGKCGNILYGISTSLHDWSYPHLKACDHRAKLRRCGSSLQQGRQVQVTLAMAKSKAGKRSKGKRSKGGRSPQGRMSTTKWWEPSDEPSAEEEAFDPLMRRKPIKPKAPSLPNRNTGERRAQAAAPHWKRPAQFDTWDEYESAVDAVLWQVRQALEAAFTEEEWRQFREKLVPEEHTNLAELAAFFEQRAQQEEDQEQGEQPGGEEKLGLSMDELAAALQDAPAALEPASASMEGMLAQAGEGEDDASIDAMLEVLDRWSGEEEEAAEEAAEEVQLPGPVRAALPAALHRACVAELGVAEETAKVEFYGILERMEDYVRAAASAFGAVGTKDQWVSLVVSHLQLDIEQRLGREGKFYCPEKILIGAEEGAGKRTESEDFLSR